MRIAASLLSSLRPEAMGYEVSEACDTLPLSGGGGEAMLNTDIQDEVWTEVVSAIDEQPDGIRTRAGLSIARSQDERLREVP